MLSHRNEILVRHLNIESAKIKVISTFPVLIEILEIGQSGPSEGLRFWRGKVCKKQFYISRSENRVGPKIFIKVFQYILKLIKAFLIQNFLYSNVKIYK